MKLHRPKAAKRHLAGRAFRRGFVLFSSTNARLNGAVRRPTKLSLARYPSPVERRLLPFDGEDVPLWVKRDDVSSDVYGGNKVRKLELLLAAARAEGKTRIVTMGAAGSHQVVATALYGAREGFEVEAVLVPQPASPHAIHNLEVAVACGLRAHVAPAWAAAPPRMMSRWGSDAYFIPLGGSNVLGSLGLVDAALELAEQIAAGELDEPDEIVVAMGSGGTVAGLAAGLERAGLRARVIAVAISPPARVLAHVARRLAKKTAEAAGLDVAASTRAAARIELVTSYIGRGYGLPTTEGEAATRAAEAAGLAVDVAYTAKALACALTRARSYTFGGGTGSSPRRVLFWHTLSTTPIASPAEPARLPARLARLFR